MTPHLPPTPRPRLLGAWLALGLLARLSGLDFVPTFDFSDGPELTNQQRFEALLAPPRTDRATLSPDGLHLAYTILQGPTTAIEVIAVDDYDDHDTIYLGDMGGARIVDMQWVGNDQVVVATEDWVIGIVDLSTRKLRKLLDPHLFETELTFRYDDQARDDPFSRYEMATPPRLLGVSLEEPDTVIVQGVAGADIRNAITLTATLNTRTGRWREIENERITSSAVDTVVDRQGRFRLMVDRARLPMKWRARAWNGERPGRWRNLDDVIDPDIAETFAADYDTLWNERSLPLGFGGDPSVLYYASSAGRDTFAVFALNLDTGSNTQLVIADAALDLAAPVGDLTTRSMGREERTFRRVNAAVYYTDFHPQPDDNPLIFDRLDGHLVGVRTTSLDTGAIWLDEILNDVQAATSADFPGRRVRLLDWDNARERFLVHVATLDDPGRYFVFHRREARWVEFIRRSPELNSRELNEVNQFAITAPDGREITGILTLPRNPLINPPPLICLFQDSLWRENTPAYSRSAQMLAEFGCMVLQVDYPGTTGRGRPIFMGARTAPDQAAFNDMRVAMDWLARDHPYDRRRVAGVGTGYGAWLALRAAEIDPNLFRCVVSMNGFNSLTKLSETPPRRERADERDHNLVLTQNIQNFFSAMQNDLENLSQTAGITAPVVSTAPEGEDGIDFQPTSFAPVLDDSQLDAVGSDPFEDSGVDLRPSRMRYMQQMMDDIETQPVHLPAVFANWYFDPIKDQLDDLSVLRNIDSLDAKVLICEDVHDPNRNNDDARALRNRLRSNRNPPEYWEVPRTTWSRPIDERPEVWLRVAEFFNENLYAFGVEIGEIKEVQE